jgi:hypothetical protein
VNQRQVLDVGTSPNSNGCVISPQHTTEPDTCPTRDIHLTDDGCIRRDICGGVDEFGVVGDIHTAIVPQNASLL